MQIRATPRVTTVPDTTAGTFLQRPIIDAQATIDKPWRRAVDAVPRPEAARLENQEVELNLDIDMTIEGDASSGPGAYLLSNGFLMPADIPAPAVNSSLGH